MARRSSDVRREVAVVARLHRGPDRAEVLPAQREPERAPRDDEAGGDLERRFIARSSSPCEDAPRVPVHERSSPSSPARRSSDRDRLVEPVVRAVGAVQVGRGDRVEPLVEEPLRALPRAPSRRRRRARRRSAAALPPSRTTSAARPARSNSAQRSGCANSGRMPFRRRRNTSSGRAGTAPSNGHLDEHPALRRPDAAPALPLGAREELGVEPVLRVAVEGERHALRREQHLGLGAPGVRARGIAGRQPEHRVRARGRVAEPEVHEEPRRREGLAGRLAPVIDGPQQVAVKVDEAHGAPRS